MYVKVRKLVAYLLRLMTNRMSAVKADMAVAFNRWKFMTADDHKNLNGVDRTKLVD